MLKRITRTSALLGPAFVAAVAYVDPGNVATNMTSGARFGYLLVWVVVGANLMAGLVQYLSAKLGLVTGMSLPEVLREHLPQRWRIPYWAQAELVAIATDLAEVLGGAIALYLLFDLPLLLGGIVTAAVSLVLLLVQDRRGQRAFEGVVTQLLAVIAVGFLAGLVVAPPDPAQAVGGLVVGFEGGASVLLAAGILGATVMPHAVYLHSALVRDRHGRTGPGRRRRRLIAATRLDVTVAMVVAGGVNLGMLLLAATALQGVAGTDTLQGAHAAISDALGPVIGLLFALALLASGLASTSVGCYAGAVIMGGLLRRRVPLLVRRLVTVTPALVVLAAGADPTWSLVISQVVLSFGIPFAIIPLVVLTARRSVMGDDAIARPTTVVASLVAAAVVALNVALLAITLTAGT